MNQFSLFAFAVIFGVLIRHYRFDFSISSKFDRSLPFGMFSVIIILLILTLCIKFNVFNAEFTVRISIFFNWLFAVFTGTILGYLSHLWIASSWLSYKHLLILTVLLFIGIGPEYFSKWVGELGILEIGNVKFESTAGKAENTRLFLGQNLSSVSPYALIDGLPPRIRDDSERIQLNCDTEICKEIIKDLDRLECTVQYSLVIISKSAAYSQTHPKINEQVRTATKSVLSLLLETHPDIYSGSAGNEKFNIQESLFEDLKDLHEFNEQHNKNEGEQDDKCSAEITNDTDIKIEDAVIAIAELKESKNTRLTTMYPYITLAQTYLQLALREGLNHGHDGKEILVGLIEWVNDYKSNVELDYEYKIVFLVRAYAGLDVILSVRQFQTDEILDIKQEYIESLHQLIYSLTKKDVSDPDEKIVDMCTLSRKPKYSEASLTRILLAEIYAKNNYLDAAFRSRPIKSSHLDKLNDYINEIRNYPLDLCFSSEFGPSFVAYTKAVFLDTDASLTCSFLKGTKQHQLSTALDCMSKWSDALSILKPLPNNFQRLAKEIERKNSLLIKSKAIRDLIQN